MDTKKQLEQANKLIFIKKYDLASKLLDKALEDSAGKNDLLIHLRRIELATRMNELSLLAQKYSHWQQISKIDQNVASICLTLLEQQGEIISPKVAIQKFQEIIKLNGESAASYFGIAFSFECEGKWQEALENYLRSVSKDPDWYPSYFGISQIYYNQNNDLQGDKYFYLYEKYAPYNLYGNFETHRNLAQEFMQQNMYEEAETAVSSLTDWWIENQGNCPIEIKVYECLLRANIHELQRHEKETQMYTEDAIKHVNAAISSPDFKENACYFIARTLEEHNLFALAHEVYKKLITTAYSNDELLQKIANTYLSSSSYNEASELFTLAYEKSPDSQSIRFCRLLIELSINGVDIEEYLSGKDQLLSLLEDEQSYSVEIFNLLHKLIALYPFDPDIQLNAAKAYIQLNKRERAKQHLETMIKFDPLGTLSNFSYATFALENGDISLANKHLLKINFTSLHDKESENKYFLLRARIEYHLQNIKEATLLLNQGLNKDPWNVELLKDIILYSCSSFEEYKSAFKSADLANVEWEKVTLICDKLKEQNQFDIVYQINKLRYLFKPNYSNLFSLLSSASSSDTKKACLEMQKLINTNFDTPEIIFALGKLRKELHQFETAMTWFEQLNQVNLTKTLEARINIEKADIYIWQNQKIASAIEYLLNAQELDPSNSKQVLLGLVHAYLKNGDHHKAQVYIDMYEGKNEKLDIFEFKYLSGLIAFNTHNVKKAKMIWKPLLTIQPTNLRTYLMKEELLKKYYVAEEPSAIQNKQVS